MTCAACAARVQAKLNKVDGVTASVNLSTERAHITAPAHVAAEDLVAVVEATGYSAELASPAEAAPMRQAPTRRRPAAAPRLILALVFFVPLTDLSIVLSLFPWARFPGWQWLLVALAAPVATWAAWPFHRAALRQARPLSSWMDTLVSLGILASSAGRSTRCSCWTAAGPGWRPAALLHASGGAIYLEVAASVTTSCWPGGCRGPGPAPAGQALRELAAAGAKDVCVLGDDGAEQRVAAAALERTAFVVRPGEPIATDGVCSRATARSTSMMTGESVPVDAAAGDAVVGGTSPDLRLVVRATRSAGTPSSRG